MKKILRLGIRMLLVFIIMIMPFICVSLIMKYNFLKVIMMIITPLLIIKEIREAK